MYSKTLQSLSGEVFFGRTMDFSHDIRAQLYRTPKSYGWTNPSNNKQYQDSYRFIGLGQELEGVLSFFDGVNEKGFAAAALYFAGYAQYDKDPISKDSQPIQNIDVLHYILGNCASIEALPALLKNIHVIGVPDPLTNTVAPLHWIAVDRSGSCVVIEPTTQGLELIPNPIGVMANSPNFNWHMTNLRNYTEASPMQEEEVLWDNLRLAPFGQAAGSMPLPGGFTSPERFVRIAYLKTHLPQPKNTQETLAACFQILANVTIPKGAVLTSRNTYDYTKYTTFINLTTCEYFIRHYDDLNVVTANLF